MKRENEQLVSRLGKAKRAFAARILCLVGIFSALVFCACNSDVVYNENKKVNERGWKAEDKLCFEFDVDDPAARYKLALNIRNTTDYPYSNVYFFLSTILPDGTVTRKDTIECVLAYPDGTWKGKGSSNVKDNRFWIAKDVSFKQKGRYVFELRQATTDTLLVGVRDVGLHIEYQ